MVKTANPLFIAKYNQMSKNNLFKYKFPEADKHIIKTLQLPNIYGISEKYYKDSSHLFSIVKNYFKSGLKIFQLRLHLDANNISKKNIEELYKESKKNNSILIQFIYWISIYCGPGATVILCSSSIAIWTSSAITNSCC